MKGGEKMKNRILFISLAVVLALSVGLVGCAGNGDGDGAVVREPSDKIIIGMSRSLTGGFAIIHNSAFGAIYPAYIARVNGAGGITVDGQQFLVDVKVLNDNSTPGTLAAHTGTLITGVEQGAVHTIFGPTCTYFIDVMSPITNEAEVVLMTVEGGGSFLIQDPGPPPLPGPIHTSPYVFLTLSFSDWYQLPVLAKILAEEGAETVYVVWQDDAHGLEYLHIAQQCFLAEGITIVGHTSVLDSPIYDYAGKLSTIAGLNPDVVCLFCYPDEIYGYTGTAIGTATNFDGWVAGPGACFGIFGSFMGIGGAAEGIITFAVANNETSNAGNPIPNATITTEELFNSIIAGGDWTWQDAWGHPLYWAAMEMWQNAVEAVGYVQDGGFMIDQDDLKDELASYNSETTGVNTVLGKTWYTMFGAGAGGGILAHECHTGEVGQWQDGYIEIIGYTGITGDIARYRTTSDDIRYPKDPWPGP